ncbi:MAG: hypothetical protein RLZZ403_1478 [Pseudomonadota bacterium]
MFLVMLAAVASPAAHGQSVRLGAAEFQPVNVSASVARLAGKDALLVVKDDAVKEFDEPTFARLTGSRFSNGVIEVRVLSRLRKDAPDFARGFIGVAFRINDDNSKFESIYLRPTNARVDNQLRRNRSTQYFSYPDFRFERLRKEAPGEYESYADMGLDEWIDVRIEVRGSQARLFLNGGKQPALVVNDLKQGPTASGAVGLWVDVGTEGYFADLRVQDR